MPDGRQKGRRSNERQSSGGGLKDHSRRARLFTVFLYRRFLADQCLMTAAALSYTTLLSLVPLLIVLFSTLSIFPAFGGLVEAMQSYVFHNFVPAAGGILQRYFQQFIDRAGTISGVGGVFLIVTALTLMKTIDEAINRVWRAQRGGRRLVVRMAVYWAVLTLGPLLLGVSIAGTSYALAMSAGIVESAMRAILFVLPFLSTAIALALIYVFVPNTKVPFRSGLIGALVAAVLFEIAKRGFTRYVAHGTAYATIYGALATIPLFLSWIYVSWVIVLFGAELSHCLTIFRVGRIGGGAASAGPGFELLGAFRIVGRLWRAQLEGRTVPSSELLDREPFLDPESLDVLMGRLQRGHVVHDTGSGDWALTRDVGEFKLLDLYRLFPMPLEQADWVSAWGRDRWDQSLGAKVMEARRRVEEGLRVLDVPLKQLYG
jgi:membrane protein